METSANWPILKTYDRDHLGKIALPLGGIGTGTVSLGGRGDLRDWELMSRPAKKFTPGIWRRGRPGFFVNAQTDSGRVFTRLLEGPVELYEYEGHRGSTVTNHGYPRFEECKFSAAYPFGRVHLSGTDLPFRISLEAFNPLIPADSDASGLPFAMLRYRVTNVSDERCRTSICGVVPNYIGTDGFEGTPNGNFNRYRGGDGFCGVYLATDGGSAQTPQWGSIALAAITSPDWDVSYRTNWLTSAGWGTPILDFWDDFSEDGMLDNRPDGGCDMPEASLAVRFDLPPGATVSVPFILSWYFPNRFTWTPDAGSGGCCDGACDCGNNVGNYYATRFTDAWDVIEQVTPRLGELEAKTLEFVRTFCESDYPVEVKEAALFNLSTLRSQTCFRTRDGHFFGWEGCNDSAGCCSGSCTHVWNYEQAVAFLFGDLARSMRRIEFEHCTSDEGRMVFRVSLPLERAQVFGKAAADGQMGCIMKMYRDWQLSGDSELMISLLPNVRRALEFCWIEGGWDSDRDGVMEGCQHNTMDVEYYGPNPQMGIWYLGALRAAEEMTRFAGDSAFADICRDLYERGRAWIDENLFNGRYYIHIVKAPADAKEVADSLRLDMGAADVTNPDFQLANGCLVDQLVGQFMAHVCGLGHLIDPGHAATTLSSIRTYNRRTSFLDHFNTFRSYVLGDESALLMASYPDGRPENPFPYFTEVMTGFEYTAAVGMIYEGQVDEGIETIRDIRDRYDGRKRSPFDEAECGHHYARAMASWAAHLALSGFHYSAIEKTIEFTGREGSYFWSTGDAWGKVTIAGKDGGKIAVFEVFHGTITFSRFVIAGVGFEEHDLLTLSAGEKADFTIS